MLNYREMYDTIVNPLDDNKVILDLINGYAEQKTMYSYLTKVNVNDKKYRGKCDRVQIDEFYAKLFNIWKENVLSLTDSQVDWLIQNFNSIDQDYHQLRTYLRTIPNVTTRKEFNDLVDSDENDLIDKYGWQNVGQFSGWVHVCSRYLKARKDPKLNVEHRLYLNTESIDTEKVSSLFVDKCMERNIPFYFKYDEYGNRDDTIVIYSDNEHLEQYISILQELKKENVELFSRVLQPPILTGKIDGWIGYGSEPEVLPNGKRTSFNEVRAKVIEKSLNSVINNFLDNHQNDMVVVGGGKKVLLSEYLSVKVAGKVIERYKEKAEDLMKRGKIEKLYSLYGLKPEDLTGGNLRQIIEKYVKQDIGNVIKKSVNDEEFDASKEISTRDGKNIKIMNRDFNYTFLEFSKEIVKFHPDFVEDVRNAIVINSKEMGIDTDKYCFDVSKRDKLFSRDSIINENDTINTNTSDISNGQKQLGKQINQEQKKDLKNENIIDVPTICERINPTFLERKMKYPNGTEIPAIQYIQEYFFPFIPEDGFFTLKNNQRIPYKQYIEDFVMLEGQEKYNGDIARLLEATTKNNRGLITVENNRDSISFYPTEIVNYINPILLERKMKYPNGAEIPAVQYLQEYFSPFIPENGKITLKNGVDIPITQYIEDFVMFEGQEKYNGDIARLLEATTKNNHGEVVINRIKEYQKTAELERILSENQTEITSGVKR